MGQELAIQTGEKYERKHDGKALASLSDQYREFVLRLCELGPSKKSATKAAESAGFHPAYGYALLRDERILAAIREEATKEVVGGVLVGVKSLIEIARNKDHKDRYKAAKDLAAMNGFAAEQRIVVEHVTHDTKTQIEQIKAMARELGMDARQLISAAGIVEGEFTDVEDDDG